MVPFFERAHPYIIVYCKLIKTGRFSSFAGRYRFTLASLARLTRCKIGVPPNAPRLARRTYLKFDRSVVTYKEILSTFGEMVL